MLSMAMCPFQAPSFLPILILDRIVIAANYKRVTSSYQSLP